MSSTIPPQYNFNKSKFYYLILKIVFIIQQFIRTLSYAKSHNIFSTGNITFVGSDFDSETVQSPLYVSGKTSLQGAITNLLHQTRFYYYKVNSVSLNEYNVNTTGNALPVYNNNPGILHFIHNTKQ